MYSFVLNIFIHAALLPVFAFIVLLNTYLKILRTTYILYTYQLEKECLITVRNAVNVGK